MRLTLALLCAGLAWAGSARAALVELDGIVQIDGSPHEFCARSAAGDLRCWSITNHTWGQPIVASAWTLPGVSSFAMSKGYQHFHPSRACAIMTTGGLRCWGSDDWGQGGTGPGAGPVPAEVPGLGGPVTAVALGPTHTCAVVSGGVKCWGNNDKGQLGDGTTTGRLEPTQVAGLYTGMVGLAAGPRHTCALSSFGSVKCWGQNHSGELGNGTIVDSLLPVDVQSLSAGVARIVAGGTLYENAHSFSGIPNGGSFTCALMTTGGVKCWGLAPNLSSLVPFDVTGLASGVASLSANGFRYYIARGYSPIHSVCVVTTGGAAKCWGSRWGYWLGDGRSDWYGSEWAEEPVDVLGLPPGGVVGIAVGGANSCALLSTGRVRCWGEKFGALPQPVMGGGRLPQAIVVGAHPPIAIGPPATLTATGGGSSNPVTFSSLSPAICAVSGSVVTGWVQGMCVIAANQAGDANYDPAPQVTFDFRVGDPVSQSITFGAAPALVVNGAGGLDATASSGLPVTFLVNTPSICSVSGSAVRGIAPGTCTVTATQAGNELYGAAPQVTQSFNVSPNDGRFGLAVAKAGSGLGSVVSSPAGIDCGSACGASFQAGSVVTLSATASAGSTFGGWTGACSGSATCTVAMTAFRDVGASFWPVVNTPRLVNLSTRGPTLTGDHVLIGGFIIGGSAPKTVLIRARGPSLAQHGVPNVLANPEMRLYLQATPLGYNDNWGDVQNAAEIQASGFAPENPQESAILATLQPGGYTVVVNGVGSTTGIAIVEVFEVGQVDAPLVNISTRGPVMTDDHVLIGGFIIGGNAPQTVVLRARGPSLAQFGVPNVLANPQLRLLSGQTEIAANDNWQQDPNAWAVLDSGYAPTNANESAIRITLQPGAYTAIVTGVGGTSGIAIVEVFRDD